MNASTFLKTFAAAAVAVSSVRAEDAPAVKAVGENTRYEAKTKSSFDLDPEARPPFWPIGWVKRDAGGPAEAKADGSAFKLEEENYSLSSILTGPPALAVINGRAYEEGQFLRISRATVEKLGNQVPRIRVQRILDGKVWLSFENETIAVGLKRGQLKEPAADEMPLNEDKEYIEPAAPAQLATPTVSRR